MFNILRIILFKIPELYNDRKILLSYDQFNSHSCLLATQLGTVLAKFTREF